ncbi:MAG: glycerophosphodiester phosphodiesterase [Methanosarcinaceae archaeon]|nr:glycerophosphodiester phosphodiesterase [Methanosarcinaceae archaeon]
MQIETIMTDSWNIFKNNIVAFIIGTLIVVIGSIFIITIAPLVYGLTYMAVRGMKGETVEINDVFEGFNNFVRSWVFVIAAVILITIGYIFLIIPGIILTILMIYALPLLVLRDYGGIDAIKESINIGKENFTDTLILFVIIVVLNAIGGSIPFAFVLILPYTTICYTLATSNLIKEAPIATTIAGEIE